MTLVFTILLWILKLAGILLAAVLGLILLILLLVLCVPIRYQADLEKRAELIWGGQVSWLFRLFHFRFRYTPTESTKELRLFGFSLMNETEEEAPEPQEKAAAAEEDLWQTDWQTIEEEEFKRKLFDYLSTEGSERAGESAADKPSQAAKLAETGDIKEIAEKTAAAIQTESRPAADEKMQPTEAGDVKGMAGETAAAVQAESSPVMKGKTESAEAGETKGTGAIIQAERPAKTGDIQGVTGETAEKAIADKEEAATEKRLPEKKDSRLESETEEDSDIWAEFEAEESAVQEKHRRTQKANWAGRKKAGNAEKKDSRLESETEEDSDIWAGFEAAQETEGDKKPAENKKQSKGKQAAVETIWWIFQKLRAYFQKNHGVILHALRWPWRMLRSVLPRRADGQIAFGLGDPAHTGYVLSLFYLFYPENHGTMEIIPDFEKMMFAGQAEIKGRILLIEIVYYALRLMIDIRIIRLLFLIKTLKAGKAAEEEKLRKKKKREKIQDSEETVLSASAEG